MAIPEPTGPGGRITRPFFPIAPVKGRHYAFVMELSINDRTVAMPAAADIERALDATSFPEDWIITLDDGKAALDAIAEPDGSFLVIHKSGAAERRGHADTATVRAAFVKYLRGDKGWQGAIRWETRAGAPGKDTTPLIGRNDNGPPPWAIAVMLGVIGLVALMFGWPDIAYALFPFAHSDWFWIGLIVLPMAVLVLLAVAAKGLDLGRSASWETTTGRIVGSKIAQRTVKFANQPERIGNYAAVTYEFKALDGRKVQGSRIGIGDDNRGADAAPTVKRYPVGAVVTVHYDPKDPRNCVLERGGPKGIEAKGCATALAELAVAGGIVWALVARGPGAVKALFPQASEDSVVMAFGLGLLLCMFAYAQWRMSKAARGWPVVAGKVVRSEVESYRERRLGGAVEGTMATLHRPVVEYAYAVAGQEYRSAQIGLNVARSGAMAWAEGVARKYPQDAAVAVRYDPDNPSNAVLENPGSVSWYLLTLAFLAFAFAAWQTRAFG